MITCSGCVSAMSSHCPNCLVFSLLDTSSAEVQQLLSCGQIQREGRTAALVAKYCLRLKILDSAGYEKMGGDKHLKSGVCTDVHTHMLYVPCRKHLKRDSPSGGPPQDPEDLFRLLKEAAAKFTASSTTTAVPVRKSRRPGVTSFFLLNSLSSFINNIK